MKYLRTGPNQPGFTIVELMVATVVFAVILMVITAGVLHFSTDYYKGINSSTTQNVAATIMNDVTQAIQFGGNVIPPSSSPSDPHPAINYFCASNQEFVYDIGSQDDSTTGVGVFQFGNDGATCWGLSGSDKYSNAPGWATRSDLLAPHMRLTTLAVSQNNDNTWNVTVGVAYGDYDLLCNSALNGQRGGCLSGDASFGGDAALASNIQDDQSGITTDLRCKPQTGSQFCDVANLTTTVQTRVGTQ